MNAMTKPLPTTMAAVLLTGHDVKVPSTALSEALIKVTACGNNTDVWVRQDVYGARMPVASRRASEVGWLSVLDAERLPEWGIRGIEKLGSEAPSILATQIRATNCDAVIVYAQEHAAIHEAMTAGFFMARTVARDGPVFVLCNHLGFQSHEQRVRGFSDALARAVARLGRATEDIAAD